MRRFMVGIALTLRTDKQKTAFGKLHVHEFSNQNITLTLPRNEVAIVAGPCSAVQ
jgi:hypothetical protein